MSDATQAFLVFRVGETLYGLPLTAIQKVFAMAWLTPVAESPKEVRGVLDVHGRVVAIIDPADRLGELHGPIGASSFIVMLNLATAAVGLKVDEVVGLETAALLPPTPETRSPPFLQGHLRTANGLVTVLNPELLLREDVRSTVEAATGAGVVHGAQ